MINVVKIYTSTCVPCKMLTPILDRLQGEYKNEIHIEQVNADNGVPELYSNLNIMRTPTLLFLRNGVLLEKIDGFKTYDELKSVIEKLLGE